MIIEIPSWILWAIGIPLCAVLVLLALIGLWFVFLLYREY